MGSSALRQISRLEIPCPGCLEEMASYWVWVGHHVVGWKETWNGKQRMTTRTRDICMRPSWTYHRQTWLLSIRTNHLMAIFGTLRIRGPVWSHRLHALVHGPARGHTTGKSVNYLHPWLCTGGCDLPAPFIIFLCFVSSQEPTVNCSCRHPGLRCVDQRKTRTVG